MAFSSPTFLAVVLTLLAMGVMSGTQAKPVEQSIPVLDITTSIKLDKPMFGDKFGPLTAGQELTLICSTEASDSVSLSWWEGDTEQQSSPKVDDGLISSSFTIQTLRIKDNGRRFTCKDQQTQAIKHIVISVETVPDLDITSSIKLDKPIFGDKFGPFTTGQELTLICSTKASDSVSLSWWEGDTEQKSSPKVDDGLISSSFTIKTLRIKDNGRRFSCKDQQTQAIKHIEISVETVPVLDITSSIKLDKPIFGDKFGPFTAGQELTLICSTEASDSVSLSWWEGDTEQQASAKVDDGLISSSFTIQTLRMEDNGRRFSCKDQQTQAIKHIKISVQTDAPTVLEVIKYDEAIEDGTVVGGTEGKDDPLIYMLVMIGIPSLFIFLLLVIILFIFCFCCNKKLTKGKQDSVSKGYKDSSAEIQNDSSRKTSKQHKHDRLSQNPLCQQEEV